MEAIRENISSHIESLKWGQRVAITATVAIVLLAVAKFVTGYLFDSRILIADAFHSGVDTLAIFASWFGLRLASRKKTAKFPYGLYRAETFITLVIGVFITLAGLENMLAGYRKVFISSVPQEFPYLPVAVSVLSLVVSYCVAKKEREAGVAINSRALLANASESFLDIGTSFVVLIGILLSYAMLPYMEGAIIILIALFITHLGIKNVWTPIMILMDANLDPQLQKEIEESIYGISGVKGVSAVKIRQSGPFMMVECDIVTSPELSVYKAHEIADRIEDGITNKYSQIESVFVHIEPSRQSVVSAIIPVQDIHGLDSKVHGHFGRAPYFIIVRMDKDKVEIEDFYHNEFLGEKNLIHVGVKVIRAILVHDLDIVFTPKIGEISFHMLKDNFVEICRAEEGLSVREVIQKYQDNQIEPIEAPHPAEESEAEKQRMVGRKEV